MKPRKYLNFTFRHNTSELYFEAGIDMPGVHMLNDYCTLSLSIGIFVHGLATFSKWF